MHWKNFTWEGLLFLPRLNRKDPRPFLFRQVYIGFLHRGPAANILSTKIISITGTDWDTHGELVTTGSMGSTDQSGNEKNEHLLRSLLRSLSYDSDQEVPIFSRTFGICRWVNYRMEVKLIHTEEEESVMFLGTKDMHALVQIASNIIGEKGKIRSTTTVDEKASETLWKIAES